MAQDLVEEGRSLGQQGKWGEALERFQRASTLSHRVTPQLAFYIGYAESRVGKLVAADVDLRRAIDLARDTNNDPVAKAAQAELPGVEARTPSLTITINGGQTPSSLQIDGSALGVAAVGSPVPVDPGEHTLIVTFAGGAVKKVVSLAEKQHSTVSIDAPPAPPAGSTPIPADKPSVQQPPVSSGPTAPPADPSSGTSGRKVASLVVAGVGGAALITGGVFYLMARSSLSPVTDKCNGASSCVASSDIQSDYKTAKNQDTIAVVLATAGAVVAATGLVFYFTGGSSVSTTTSPSATLVPWVGPGGGGAGLIGSF